LRKIIDRTNRYINYITIATISMMLLIIFLQVIFRYVLHNSLSFSEELARYLFVYTIFLGIPIIARQDGHIAVEILTQKLKGRVARYTKIITYICILIFAIILFYFGTRMMILTTYQLSPALRIPMPFIYLAIPTGSFLLFCNILILMIDILNSYI